MNVGTHQHRTRLLDDTTPSTMASSASSPHSASTSPPPALRPPSPPDSPAHSLGPTRTKLSPLDRPSPSFDGQTSLEHRKSLHLNPNSRLVRRNLPFHQSSNKMNVSFIQEQRQLFGSDILG